MTDRELLELAAKAAGFDTIIEMYGLNDIGEPLLDANDPPTVWNPFADDGDALRLFYTLPWMCIETSDVGVTVRERGNPDEPSRVYLMWTEWLDEHNGDLAPATRRAIVRAAAHFGKAMP